MSIGHLYVLFGEVSIQVICPFFNWVVCSFGVELYILDINLLPDVSANMFSHIMDGFYFVGMKFLIYYFNLHH